MAEHEFMVKNYKTHKETLSPNGDSADEKPNNIPKELERIQTILNQHGKIV